MHAEDGILHSHRRENLKSYIVLFLGSIRMLLITAKVIPISPILVVLMTEAKQRFLQEPHNITSQKTTFSNS
jgi:hypothetical protein